MPEKLKTISAPGILESFRDQIYSCTRCAACVPVCPTYNVTGEEALSARGRINLMAAVLDGRLGLTRGLAQRLSQCLSCGACTTACPSGVDIPAAILSMRETFFLSGNRHLARTVTRGLIGADASRPGHRLLAAVGAIYRCFPSRHLLPWQQGGHRRSFPRPGFHPLEALLPEISRAEGASRRVALFPGCATSLAYQQTAVAAVRVLNRAGVEVVLPRGLGCCGLPFRSLGDAETARRLARASLRALGTHKVDEIITVCSSCALALKDEAARTPGAMRVADIHELLFEIDAPPAPLTGTPAGRITWQDPCHLGRGLGLTREPREIIAGLPGVEYVEAGMLSCCGGGGAFSLLHYDLALKIGSPRAEALAATGARQVATGCPGCRMQIEDMLARLGSPVKVVHTVELLDDAAVHSKHGEV